MDRDVLYEMRKAFLEEWITKEDLMDAFQRKLISYSEYLWVIGALDEEVVTCKIIVQYGD